MPLHIHDFYLSLAVGGRESTTNEYADRVREIERDRETGKSGNMMGAGGDGSGGDGGGDSNDNGG